MYVYVWVLAFAVVFVVAVFAVVADSLQYILVAVVLAAVAVVGV